MRPKSNSKKESLIRQEPPTPVLEEEGMYNRSNTPHDSSGPILQSSFETSDSTEQVESNRHWDSETYNERLIGSSSQRGSNAGVPNVNAIRLINKDMRNQFQGRTHSLARIRWFENRKSQVLGFCLCMALFGLTISLYKKRWVGLIFGSTLTLVCSSAVVYTYHTKKKWHQHPNPIVHMRSVLSFFLAICLLVNVYIDYRFDDPSTTCTQLAGFTEFFVITSEAWGLMMAFDLFSSLMSPFADYKRQMKFYHLWVWTLGIGMAIATWSLENAAGFFRVDGQRIESTTNKSSLVGFCLASSQVCCSKTDTNCTGEVCGEGNFLHAQKWPWILVYIFVIFVLVVSVSVLILAWHRLFLRGVPKTYHIRLRVLNYVSFFTGAYVFYWLLLLLLYMSAYFVSSKVGGGSDETTIGAQVLRQVVAFIISSKGYLDYVIWFAVNSIEWRPADGRPLEHGNESADIDVDLSPQVNTALRSEILYYTTSGITQSVEEVHGLPTGRCEQEVFMLGNADSKEKIKFWSFRPHTFRTIREHFGINDIDYVQLFSATTKERFSEGRSGAFMFFTSDESLIVKTMSVEECSLLRKMAPDYCSYFMNYPNSLLTRFYGCHAVSLYGKTYYFVVMGNLFAQTGDIHHRYDIKGSWVSRNASYPKPGDSAHCRYCNASYTYGSKRNQECGDGLNYHEPNIVLKDNDLLSKIRIDPNQAVTLYSQLLRDSEFLCKKGIMDYSLLMGVQSCEYYVEPGSLTARMVDEVESGTNDGSTSTSTGFRTKVATSVNGPALYHFGIIDFLQQWTFEKKAERFYKTRVLRKDPDGLSALPPRPYMVRFHQKMAQILAVSFASEEEYSQFAGSRHYRPIPTGLLDALDHGPRGTVIGAGTTGFTPEDLHCMGLQGTDIKNSTPPRMSAPASVSSLL